MKKDQVKLFGVQEFKRDTERLDLKNPSRSRKRTETFNDLVSETEKEIAEISQLISDKREEFQLQPKYVEVLENRLQKVLNEVERIKNKMTPEYREIKAKINSYFGDIEDSIKKFSISDSIKLNNFREYVLEKKLSIPEVKDFYEKVGKLRYYEQDGLDTFKKEFKSFREKIDEIIKEKTEYKTQGEEKEAYA